MVNVGREWRCNVYALANIVADLISLTGAAGFRFDEGRACSVNLPCTVKTVNLARLAG